jgi:hypothetical protein
MGRVQMTIMFKRKGGTGRMAPIMLFILLFLLMLLHLPPVGQVQADSQHRYTILKETCDLRVNPNGGAHIEYLISIQNEGKLLEGLDIRMPNRRYDLSSAQARISGFIIPEDNIKQSGKYENGVYLDFGSYPIPTNGLGSVWLRIWDPVIAFEDDKYQDYSKIDFTPAWFPEEENTYTRELEYNIHLPAGIPTNDIFVLGEMYTTLDSIPEGIKVQWVYENINWSRGEERKDLGVRVPSEHVEAHSQFWEITIYEYLDFFTPLNIAILIGIVIVLIVAIILLNRAIGKRVPYNPPSFTKEISRVDHSIGPTTFAYLDGKRPRRILAMLLVQSLKEGVVKIETKEPLRLSQGKGKSTIENNPFQSLKNGALDLENTKAFFQGLRTGLDEKGKVFDMGATKKHFAKRVDNAWSRLASSKGALEESKNLDRELLWMLMDKGMKKRWGRHIHTRDEVNIPEWLFLFLYDDKEYRRKRVQAKGSSPFLDFLKNKTNSVFNLSGVTIDGEDFDEKLIDTLYQLEEGIESRAEIKKYLSTINRYTPRASEKKPNLRNLPEANRGAYIKYGGGA